MACRLFMRMRMRNNLVKEQIQQVLSYIQKRSANIWKKNILKDLEVRELIYAIIKESRAEKQDNGEVCTEVQKSSKRQWIQKNAISKRV